jgi:hypothetical protein
VTEAPEPTAAPLFQVVKGSPTVEELAALVTVLSAASAAPDVRPAPSTATGWSAYWRRLRSPLQPGTTGAWRASGRSSLG